MSFVTFLFPYEEYIFMSIMMANDKQISIANWKSKLMRSNNEIVCRINRLRNHYCDGIDAPPLFALLEVLLMLLELSDDCGCGIK